MDSQNENGNSAGKWLLFAGLSIGVLAGYLHTTDDQKDMASRATTPVMTSADQALQNQMNSNLKDATVRSDLKKETMQEDDAGSNTISERDIERNERTAPIPLVLEQQNSANDIARDEMPKALEPMTPDQRVSLMLQRNEWLKDYDQAYQQEYIRQFLKNAHDHGVSVRLNKNLDVTGLSVNRSNQPIRFPTSSTSAK